MPKVNHVPFDEVFNYATREFNISWNKANDLFFNNAFEYGQIDFYEIEEKYLDLTKDEILQLSKIEKANAITSQYLSTLGLTGDIYIDSK